MWKMMTIDNTQKNKQRENESSLRNLRYPIQSFKASLKQLKVEHINHREMGSTRGWWETNSVCVEWSVTDFWFLILVLAEVRISTCDWKLRHRLEKSDKDRRKEWERFNSVFACPRGRHTRSTYDIIYPLNADLILLSYQLSSLRHSM